MLLDTHEIIARDVGEILDLDYEKQIRMLVEGCRYPDSFMEFPHHKGKDDEIWKNVVESRTLFLHDDDECYYKLGIALHFVQDKWTFKPRTGDMHTAWEKSIHKNRFPAFEVSTEKVFGIPLPRFVPSGAPLGRIFINMKTEAFPYLCEEEIKKLPLPSKYIQKYLEYWRVLNQPIVAVEVLVRGKTCISAVDAIKYFTLLSRDSDIYVSHPVIDYLMAFGLSKGIAQLILYKSGSELIDTSEWCKKTSELLERN